MANITEPARFDVAIELIVELSAHYSREHIKYKDLGDQEAAQKCLLRSRFWYDIRHRLYRDSSIDDEDLDGIIAEAGARLQELDAMRGIFW